MLCIRCNGLNGDKNNISIGNSRNYNNTHHHINSGYNKPNNDDGVVISSSNNTDGGNGNGKWWTMRWCDNWMWLYRCKDTIAVFKFEAISNECFVLCWSFFVLCLLFFFCLFVYFCLLFFCYRIWYIWIIVCCMRACVFTMWHVFVIAKFSNFQILKSKNDSLDFWQREVNIILGFCRHNIDIDRNKCIQ